MAGFREFVTGEVLTAGNVMDFLAKQAVMKFADAAARDAALGTAVVSPNALREGMVAYLDDEDSVIAYNGSAWVGLGTDALVRTGTDSTELQVADDGQIEVADATSPTPVVRPLPFASETGTITSSSIAANGRTTTTVTFTAGRFTVAPVVTNSYHASTANNAAAGLCTVNITSITSASFSLARINGFASGAISMEATWLAVQLEV